MSERRTKTTEWGNGLLLVVLAIWIWWYSANFPSLDEGYPGPALFPRIVAVGFALCGLLLLYPFRGSLKLGSRPLEAERILTLAGGLLIIVLFPFLLEFIGFVPALGILCLGFGFLLRVIWWKAILTAGLTAGIIYFLFVIGLGVSL
jgi:putative tricarboxylic transport membrane protein